VYIVNKEGILRFLHDHLIVRLSVLMLHFEVGWFFGEEYKLLSVSLFEVYDDVLTIFSFQTLKFAIWFGLDLENR
jgi:hypothetical protein